MSAIVQYIYIYIATKVAQTLEFGNGVQMH